MEAHLTPLWDKGNTKLPWDKGNASLPADCCRRPDRLLRGGPRSPPQDPHHVGASPSHLRRCSPRRQRGAPASAAAAPRATSPHLLHLHSPPPPPHSHLSSPPLSILLLMESDAALTKEHWAPKLPAASTPPSAGRRRWRPTAGTSSSSSTNTASASPTPTGAPVATSPTGSRRARPATRSSCRERRRRRRGQPLLAPLPRRAAADHPRPLVHDGRRLARDALPRGLAPLLLARVRVRPAGRPRVPEGGRRPEKRSVAINRVNLLRVRASGALTSRFFPHPCPSLTSPIPHFPAHRSPAAEPLRLGGIRRRPPATAAAATAAAASAAAPSTFAFSQAAPPCGRRRCPCCPSSTTAPAQAQPLRLLRTPTV